MIRLKYNFVGLVITLLVLCSCVQKHYNEWVDSFGKMYYYNEEGKKLINCYSEIDGDLYFFDSKGHLLTDTIVKYDNESGIVFLNGKLDKGTGLRAFKNNWYYIKDGKIQRGIVKEGGVLHFFDEEGKMISTEGWHYDDNKNTYVYIEDGKAKTGWIKENNNWYYILPSGYMGKDWQKIDGEWYYFDKKNGDLKTSTFIDDTYLVDENGKMIHSGWFNINGQMLYFENDGKINRSRNYEQEIRAQQNALKNQKNNSSSFGSSNSSSGSKGTFAKKSINANSINNILKNAYPIWNEFRASTNYNDKLVKSKLLESYGNTLCDICQNAYTIDKISNNTEGMKEDQLFWSLGLTFIGTKKWD